MNTIQNKVPEPSIYRYGAWALTNPSGSGVLVGYDSSNIPLFTSKKRAKDSGLKHNSIVRVIVTVEEKDQI